MESAVFIMHTIITAGIKNMVQKQEAIYEKGRTGGLCIQAFRTWQLFLVLRHVSTYTALKNYTKAFSAEKQKVQGGKKDGLGVRTTPVQTTPVEMSF